MKKLTIAAALAAATMLAGTAHAGDAEGKLQVKLLATGVLPDGKITALENNAIGLPAGSQTKAKDRKSTRLNSSHIQKSRMPSSA